MPLSIGLYDLVFPSHNFTYNEFDTFLHSIKKLFHAGSYAIITEKTNIKYNTNTHHVIIELHYCVKNPEGVIQWPIGN